MLQRDRWVKCVRRSALRPGGSAHKRQLSVGTLAPEGRAQDHLAAIEGARGELCRRPNFSMVIAIRGMLPSQQPERSEGAASALDVYDPAALEPRGVAYTATILDPARTPSPMPRMLVRGNVLSLGVRPAQAVGELNETEAQRARNSRFTGAVTAGPRAIWLGLRHRHLRRDSWVTLALAGGIPPDLRARGQSCSSTRNSVQLIEITFVPRRS